MPPDIAALIPAAGRASRFGSCKQLARLQGKPLLQHVIDAASALEQHRYIISGHWHSELQAARQQGALYGAQLLHCPDWDKGLGHTIRWGVGQLRERYRGILILLSDQAALRPDHIAQLLCQFDGDHVICSRYDGHCGVPALFPARCYDALQRLEGDQGARALLNPADPELIRIELPCAALDIDTPEALRQARHRLERP